MTASDGPRWPQLPSLALSQMLRSRQPLAGMGTAWLSHIKADPQQGQQAAQGPPVQFWSQRHMRVQARRMIEDIEVVGAAFADALAEVSIFFCVVFFGLTSSCRHGH